MTSFLDAPTQLLTSWTLARDGHTLTCALSRLSSGTYVLRLRHEGQPIFDEKCASPQEAMTRSLEALHVFIARGWLPENTAN
ncbi:MAG: hypothetical protein ACRD3C_15250 [Vicinamibacterales bacterium]